MSASTRPWGNITQPTTFLRRSGAPFSLAWHAGMYTKPHSISTQVCLRLSCWPCRTRQGSGVPWRCARGRAISVVPLFTLFLPLECQVSASRSMQLRSAHLLKTLDDPPKSRIPRRLISLPPRHLPATRFPTGTRRHGPPAPPPRWRGPPASPFPPTSQCGVCHTDGVFLVVAARRRRRCGASRPAVRRRPPWRRPPPPPPARRWRGVTRPLGAAQPPRRRFAGRVPCLWRPPVPVAATMAPGGASAAAGAAALPRQRRRRRLRAWQ